MEQLCTDFFKLAIGEGVTEELEKVQLQNAISALSEKLLLFSNISTEKDNALEGLKSSEAARIDL